MNEATNKDTTPADTGPEPSDINHALLCDVLPGATALLGLTDHLWRDTRHADSMRNAVAWIAEHLTAEISRVAELADLVADVTRPARVLRQIDWATYDAGTVGPDADLVRICGEHIANRAAYNEHGGRLELECDPLWLAYERTRDAISDAKPQTMAGMLAKARAAIAEARRLDGTEEPEGTPAATWAFDLANDLLRLHGAAA